MRKHLSLSLRIGSLAKRRNAGSGRGRRKKSQFGESIGLPPRASGLIVTLTQIGYGLCLLFIVPLGDLVENRRLVVLSLLVAGAALSVAAIAQGAALFLAAALVLGIGSVAAQVLVPFAAHLSPESTRGRVVGKVMSGLLFGIALRPAW